MALPSVPLQTTSLLGPMSGPGQVSLPLFGMPQTVGGGVGQYNLGFSNTPTYDPGLAAAQTNNAGNLAATQQQGYNQLANTGLSNQGSLADVIQQGYNALASGAQQGQYGLLNTALSGQYGLANTGLSGQYGLQEAQTSALPGLINSIGQQQYRSALFPYVTGIMSQVAPLIGDIGGMIQGLPGGGFTGAGGPGGGIVTGQGVNVSPSSNPMGGTVNVPNSVIAPSQANTMLDANTAQGNMAAANTLAGANNASPALQSQLASQLGASNQSGLDQATTQFLSQLAPANAQQALSSAQLSELARSNLANQALGFAGVPIQRFGGLANMISGITSKALNGGF